MPLNASLDRFSGFVARGDADGLSRYLVACLPAGAPLEPVREVLARDFTAEFQALAYQVAPWLAEARIDRRGSARKRILAKLHEAKADGVALSQLSQVGPDRNDVLEAMIRSGEVVRERRTTGGRPGDRYRLAEHAAGITPADNENPFAFKPRPLDF